jgi:hypothetical protein
MRHETVSRLIAATIVASAVVTATSVAIARQAPSSLGIASGRVSISGTSNIHPYTASTTSVRVRGAKLTVDVANPALLTEIAKPGALQDFEIAVQAATLASGKDGLDKNMLKALKAQEHPEITFRLNRLDAAGAPGALRAAGVLNIAGVDRNVTLDVTVQLNGSTLTVKGAVPLLMTDYGITPPKAMLGMLKTDPKVTVTFEASLIVPAATVAGTN